MQKNSFSTLFLSIAALFIFIVSSASGAAAQTAARPRIFQKTNFSAPVRKTATGDGNFIKKIINIAALERRIFELINQKRSEFGLPPVQWSEDLSRVARLHSQNMADLKFFSHQGIDGKRVNNRADQLGVTKWKSLGENIAYNRGYGSPLESAVQSWMNSAGHRKNLLSNRWKKSGVGIAVLSDGTYYFTQVFLRN